MVSLDNLERAVAASADIGEIQWFVDSILSRQPALTDIVSPEALYWVLEPNDYADPAAFRVPVSKRVDRVLAYLSSDGKLVSWATRDLLRSLDLSDDEAEAIAFSNLARALTQATIETSQVDEVTLGMIGTPLPFKASFILAPNLKEIVGNTLGWDLLAVLPDRDFLYLWAARHEDFAGCLGEIVVREYTQAPYPISTEIFEISDQGVRAIGAFSS